VDRPCIQRVSSIHRNWPGEYGALQQAGFHEHCPPQLQLMKHALGTLDAAGWESNSCGTGSRALMRRHAADRLSFSAPIY
jgi:hypothetical protein